MRSNVFEHIKEAVTLPEAAGRYGIGIEHNGLSKCPFHKSGTEKHPSMKLYPTYFKCFACGESGDVIALAQKLFGLSSPLEAARKLDADFTLNLFPDKPLSASERKAARDEAERRERDKRLVETFDSWCDGAFDTVRWYLRHLQYIKEHCAPKNTTEPFTNEFAQALREFADIEYLFDILAFGTLEEKAILCNHWRKRVREIEEYRQSRNLKESA